MGTVAILFFDIADRTAALLATWPKPLPDKLTSCGLPALSSLIETLACLIRCHFRFECHIDSAGLSNCNAVCLSLITNQIVSRSMPTPGLANVRCNGGHAWMNAEILVVPHPYY